MGTEANILINLTDQFPSLAGHVRVQRDRRIWAEIPADQFETLLVKVIADHGFTILCAITGTDEGENLGLIYHLAQPSGIVLNLKTAIPKAHPVWKSVLPHFPGCAIYERELVDLLGFQIEGLPPGDRYPLTDDWPKGQFPLRKDWKQPAPAADAAAAPTEVKP